ncbi:MAG: hypothetical protein KGL53_01495, partial [Elusimicrobia bacterium]|nr:hypothetical protein [Elusimicrobiota bacterium]
PEVARHMLRRALNAYEGRIPPQSPAPGAGGLWMLLQALALGSGIYLWKYSPLPYVLGRRRTHATI